MQTALQESSGGIAELKDDQIEARWSVLLIADDAREAQGITQHLKRCGACGDVAHCRGLGSALALLAAQTFDAVIAELAAPPEAGLTTLGRLRAAAPDAALIAISQEHDEALGAQLLTLGAQRYLFKAQLDGETLGRTLRQAVARKRGEKPL